MSPKFAVSPSRSTAEPSSPATPRGALKRQGATFFSPGSPGQSSLVKAMKKLTVSSPKTPQQKRGKPLDDLSPSSGQTLVLGSSPFTSMKILGKRGKPAASPSSPSQKSKTAASPKTPFKTPKIQSKFEKKKETKSSSSKSRPKSVKKDATILKKNKEFVWEGFGLDDEDDMNMTLPKTAMKGLRAAKGQYAPFKKIVECAAYHYRDTKSYNQSFKVSTESWPVFFGHLVIARGCATSTTQQR